MIAVAYPALMKLLADYKVADACGATGDSHKLLLPIPSAVQDAIGRNYADAHADYQFLLGIRGMKDEHGYSPSIPAGLLLYLAIAEDDQPLAIAALSLATWFSQANHDREVAANPRAYNAGYLDLRMLGFPRCLRCAA